MSPTLFRACIEKLFLPAFDCFPSVSRLLCQLSSCFRPLLKINFAELKIISIFAVQYRGVEQLVARRAHNPEVGGSSPPPATKTKRPFRPLFLFYHPYIVIRTISRGVPGLTLLLHATVPFCRLDASPVKESPVEEWLEEE